MSLTPTLHEKFVARFGLEQALRVVAASREHAKSLGLRHGSDEFRHVLVSVITHGCCIVEALSRDHGITIPFADFREFMTEHAELDKYDGELDPVATRVHAYAAFMPRAWQWANVEKVNACMLLKSEGEKVVNGDRGAFIGDGMKQVAPGVRMVELDLNDDAEKARAILARLPSKIRDQLVRKITELKPGYLEGK